MPTISAARNAASVRPDDSCHNPKTSAASMAVSTAEPINRFGSPSRTDTSSCTFRTRSAAAASLTERSPVQPAERKTGSPCMYSNSSPFKSSKAAAVSLRSADRRGRIRLTTADNRANKAASNTPKRQSYHVMHSANTAGMTRAGISMALTVSV